MASCDFWAKISIFDPVLLFDFSDKWYYKNSKRLRKTHSPPFVPEQVISFDSKM